MRRLALRMLLLAALASVLAPAAGAGTSAPAAHAVRALSHDASPPLALMRRTRARTPLAAARALATATTFEGISSTGAAVPDPTVDVGATQLVETVTDAIAVFAKSGSLVAGPVAMTTFWAGLQPCASSAAGKPVVAYDVQARRWVVAELAGSSACVAVSASGDATGTWYRYAYTLSTTKTLDRLRLGVWSDGYYVSVDQYVAGVASGVGVAAFERAQMLSGGSAQARVFDLASVRPGLWGMLPADANGPSAASGDELFAGVVDDPADVADHIELWKFHVDWSSTSGSSFTPVQQLSTAAFTTSFCTVAGTPTACLSQQTQAQKLDPAAGAQLSGRLQWRTNGGTPSLLLDWTVNSGSDRAGVRWASLAYAAGSWSIAHGGTWTTGDGSNAFLGSAAMDASGNVGLGYEATGRSTDPAVRYVTFDPSGSSLGDVTLQAAGVGQTSGTSFGTSTVVALDPVDDCTFWVVGEYYPSTTSGWHTRIGSFSVPGCAALGGGTPQNTVRPSISGQPQPVQGQTLTADDGTWSVLGTAAHQWRRCDAQGINCVDIAGATGATYVIGSADSDGRSTIRLAVTDTVGGQSATALSPPTSLIQSAGPVNTGLPVVSGTAVVGQTLTASNGSWQSSSPVGYTYAWQRCGSGTCTTIAGATASSYTVAAADVGFTLQIVVSATNTGGGTTATSAQTATVVATLPTGSNGTAPDLQLAAAAGSGSFTVGDTFSYTFTVTNNALVATTSSWLNIGIPSGVQVQSTASTRGSACTANSATISCSLGAVPAKVTDTITITVAAIADGDFTATGSLTSQPTDSNTANDTASVVVHLTRASTAGGSSSSGTDTSKPTVAALTSVLRAGAVARLRFRIYDDAGVASATLQIRKGKRLVATTKSGYGAVTPGIVYYLPWKVPKKVHGTLSFCVTARDKAGNTSRASCAPLRVR
jgi:hypothetical protein